MKTVKNALVVVSALTLFAALAGPAAAHHGWRSYDSPLDIEVVIVETHWGNPHDRLTVTDEDGGEWNVLLAPPVRNRRYGFDEDTVKIGQTVRLRGERHPTRNEGKIHQIWLGDQMVYEYLYGDNYTSYDRLGKDAPKVAPQTVP